MGISMDTNERAEKKPERKRNQVLFGGGFHESVAEQMLNSILDKITDPVLDIMVGDQRIGYANPAAAGFLGYPAHRLCGMTVRQIIEDHGFIAESLNSRASMVSGVRFVDKRGEVYVADIRFIHYTRRDAACALLLLTGAAIRHKDRDRHPGLQLLATEMMKTHSAFFLGEDHERQRLSREVHSLLGPLAISVKLGLEHLLAAKKRYIPRKELKKLLDVQTNLIKEMRVTTSRLAKGYEFQEDINRAIESLVREYSASSAIRISHIADSLPDDLPRHVSYHLVQIVEEALTNMALHANTEEADFRVTVAGGLVTVALQDYGQGCDTPAVVEGKGLWMMQRRAALIDGHLVVTSAAGQGFRVRLDFPVVKRSR